MSSDWTALDEQLNAYRAAQLQADWRYRWRYLLTPLGLLAMLVGPMLVALVVGAVLLGVLPLLTPEIVLVGVLFAAAALGLGTTYK